MSVRAVATAAILTAASAQGAPHVVWLSEVHDFGAFDESVGTAECRFLAVNTGDAPLVFLSAKANCGCTTPAIPTEPLMPGDTAAVTVGYNAIGRPGRFSKSVAVTTNATPARSTLTIKGTVIGASNTLRSRYPIEAGAMRLRRRTLEFGEVSTSSTAGDYIEGYNATADTIHPMVISSPAYISVVMSPAEVPPGENFVVSCVFDPAACGLYDLVTSETTVAAGADEPAVTLTATAIVNEDFSRLTHEQLAKAPRITINPETLDAGRIDTGSNGRRALSFKMEIANAGKRPLNIRRIYSADKALKFDINKTTVKPGGKAMLKVTLDKSDLAGRDMLNSRIVIITDDPVTPRRTVRLVGEII